MSQFVFDATKVAPQGDRSAVPAGNYKVILKSSDIKQGKTTADKMMVCGFQILEGPLVQQMIFQNLNVVHSNPVAQSIAQERLSALCHAVGVLQISDTAQLHGRPLMLKVSQRKENDADPNSKTYNEIDAFLKEDGSAVTGGGAVSGPSAPPAFAMAQASGAPPPAPQPVAPPPAAPPAPAPAPVVQQLPGHGKLFFVAHNGQVITQQPITADQVRALPQGLGALNVLENGTQAWIPGTTLAIPTAPPAPVSPPPATAPTAPPPPAAPAGTGAMPPWMQAPPPAA